MLPASLLSFERGPNGVLPDYLGRRDLPWLRALIEEYLRFEGRTFRELSARLSEPLSPDGPRPRKARAVAVLDRLCRDPAPPVARAREVREALFRAASKRPADPIEWVTADVAAAFGVSVAELERALFADLGPERRVAPPAAGLSPVAVARETNTALVKGLLARATGIAVELAGNGRAVVTHARRRGLICAVHQAGAGGALLTISGPLALFRRTRIYGRALASVVDSLAGCDRFRLRADCVIDGAVTPVEVSSGDPLARPRPPRLDRALEERLARDFGRLAPDWHLASQPGPIETAGGLVFADFALEHRRDPTRRWLLEIVGFWTRDYLERKLEADNLILCVDARRSCDGQPPPESARLVRYRRRIDPRQVLAVIEPGDRPTRA